MENENDPVEREESLVGHRAGGGWLRPRGTLRVVTGQRVPCGMDAAKLVASPLRRQGGGHSVAPVCIRREQGVEPAGLDGGAGRCTHRGCVGGVGGKAPYKGRSHHVCGSEAPGMGTQFCPSPRSPGRSSTLS